MTKLIGDKTRKSYYNPDLARIVNEEVERADRQRKLEALRRKNAGLPPEPDTPPAAPPLNPVTISSAGDYIKLENIVCTDADGNVFERYDEIYVKKEVEKSPDSKIIQFTPYQAIQHCQQQGDFLPSSALMANITLALFHAAVERQANGTYKTKNVDLEKVLQKFKDRGDGVGGHWVNTLVNWSTPKIIHYPIDADFTSHGGTAGINAALRRAELAFDKTGFAEKTLAEAVATPNYYRYLQNYTGMANPEALIEVAHYFGKTARCWISTGAETRAAWFGCDDTGDFYLSANNILSNSNAARGVRRGGERSEP